jgi:hypothetical protein
LAHLLSELPPSDYSTQSSSREDVQDEISIANRKRQLIAIQGVKKELTDEESEKIDPAKRRRLEKGKDKTDE